MELLGLYNEKGEFLHKQIERGTKNLPKGEYIRIVTVWIQNDKGEFLIQLAGGNKLSEWATTGGHVQLTQTPLSAVVQEIKEELNITVQESQLEHKGFEILKSAIFDVYYLKADYDLNDLTLQEEEVEKVQWLNKSQIIKLIEEGKFRRSHTALFQKHFI